MNGAVITAKDEADSIGWLVEALKKQGLDVIVIDDGSADETGRLAEQAGAFVLRHDESKGIGKSLMEAWNFALERGWEYTVQIDAGGSHDPNQWQGWDWNEPDVKIGSRFSPGAKYIGRGWRALASRTVAGMLNWATHQNITDWTSGYRVFNRKALFVLVNCRYMTNMHTWQIEVLFEAVRKGLKISEFPITYKAGDSTFKWKTIDDLIKVYLWILNVA